MAVPNIFGSATAAIPLSQLDTNFATPVTIGNTAVQLGNTVTSFGNVTLTNVTISSGNVTITGANVSGTANVSTLIVTGNQTSLGNVSITGNVSANIATFGAGTAALPAITTTGDTNTGIFFPAADTIAFSEGGVESARFDSAGNFGLGVIPSAWSSTYNALQIKSVGRSLAQSGAGAGDWTLAFNAIYSSANSRWDYAYTGDAAVRYSQTGAGIHAWFNAASGTAGNAISFTQAMTLDADGDLGIGNTSPAARIDAFRPTVGTYFLGGGGDNVARQLAIKSSTTTNSGDTHTFDAQSATGVLAFATISTERARIDSSGNLLVGKIGTDNTTIGVAWQASGAGNSVIAGGAEDGPQIQVVNTTASGTAPNGYRYFSFRLGAGATEIGTITKASATTVAYNTSSDYRLKYDVAPMTGALEKVKQLKPCTYKWHEDDSDGEGFIAHELAEVCPYAVTGKKDAVNEDGSIKPQGVDTSFLVATLTAAIQEQQVLITQLTARITALEGA